MPEYEVEFIVCDKYKGSVTAKNKKEAKTKIISFTEESMTREDACLSDLLMTTECTQICKVEPMITKEELDRIIEGVDDEDNATDSNDSTQSDTE